MGAKSVASAFGKVLRDAREAAGLSQEDLASDADIDRTYVSMLERGVRQPTLETIFRLAKAVKLTPAALVSRTTALLD
jgi:transcriptional regulator with XRE-family HTH domain